VKKKENKTVRTVYELAAPIAEKLGLTLWDIRFTKEGSMWILSIIIDKEGGVSIDDCEAMSRPLDAKLDEVDPIEQSYCLEVSSAGMERELTRDWHFEALKGKEVVVKLIRPYNGEREFRGVLEGLVEESVVIRTEQGALSFLLADIAHVRLYVDFDNIG
jgi:ribosome maturation factor RimP